MNIGFIGLGNMGSGMAGNLLNYAQAHNHRLTVFDINSVVVEDFVSRGAAPAKSANEVAAVSQVLFTSLPSAKEINQLALGGDGLLAHLKPGAVWFETSTNESAEWSKVLAQASDDIHLVDAPVTGGQEGAAAGTLTMLLGISAELHAEYQELLASLTAKAVRMGPSGAGYVAKLCQLHLNYLVAQGIGEAMMLGAKAELDLTNLHGILQTSCAQSYVVDRYVPMVLDGSYDPSFTLGLATKDMRLITGLGEHLDVPLPLGNKVYHSYQQAVAAYGEDEPHLKIVKLLEDDTGTLLRN